MIELLLKNGANVNARCDDDDTLLHVAVFHRKLSLIKLLLKYKADINRKGGRNGSTPLHRAVALKYEDVTKLLIEKGANVNARDNRGNTPLHAAADGTGYPNKNIITMLVRKGANKNSKNNRNLKPIDVAGSGLAVPKDIQDLLQPK